ncbi:type IV secretory system conjugative DNA transfer family protein [Planctomicrobium sp. SH664]|uniref:type IV secretory system conjugative DNA transfer family protein n=1 Tax=Planctomicrobium sp. SH664 TaxID=3448125 RepID=UPI003F5B4050
MLQQQPSDLLDDLPRGRSREHIGTPPHAYFESTRNLAATESLRFDAERNEDSKLFLGVIGGQVVTGDRLPDGRLSRHVVGGTPIGLGDDRHHVLVAGSRATKGRAVLLPNLVCIPPTTSLLVLDPKGELARLTAVYRAKVLKQKVIVLDPFGVSGPETKTLRGAFNALAMLDPDDRRSFVPNAKLIADSLIVSGDFKDRHWDETAKQILAGLIMHVATYERYEGVRDLVTVWHLASELTAPDPDHPKLFWLEQEMLANGDAAGGMVRNATRGFYDRSGGEFSSVLSNLRKHLDFLGIECMRDVLCGLSVNLRDMKRSSLALYSCVPAMRQGDLKGWQRMLVQLTMGAHEEEPIQTGGASVLVLEEFHALGHLECLELAAAQFASLLKLLVVLQDLTQVQSRYPKSWETFLGNCGCLQVFGLADQTTLEYVSKKLGETATITRSTNSPGFDQATQHAATGESWSLGTSRLLTPEEIGRFFARDDKQLRQLIFRPGYRPAILQRAFYDQHELFRGRFSDA